VETGEGPNFVQRRERPNGIGTHMFRRQGNKEAGQIKAVGVTKV
jgi:hypothetical protein